MKLLRIPRTIYRTVHDNRDYEEIYMGNLISSTADTVTYPAWDSTQTYNALDTVYIPELHTTYTAKIDSPKGHPSTSRDWFKEGDNTHKMLDAVFSSKSIFTNECIVEFDVAGMDYILGRGIINAKEVQFEFYDFSGNPVDTDFNCDTCAEVQSLITMTYDEEFNCFSCCNKDPIINDSFVLPIDRDFCETVYKGKITITKDDPSKPIFVSTLCVADSYDFGCALKGFKIGDKIPVFIGELCIHGKFAMRPALKSSPWRRRRPGSCP